VSAHNASREDRPISGISTPSPLARWSRAGCSRPACCLYRLRTYGAFMERSGRNPWQPVANGLVAKTARASQKPLPWVATGCRSERMVRRGSPVRVRKRALRKPRNPRGFVLFLGNAIRRRVAPGSDALPRAPSESLAPRRFARRRRAHRKFARGYRACALWLEQSDRGTFAASARPSPPQGTKATAASPSAAMIASASRDAFLLSSIVLTLSFRGDLRSPAPCAFTCPYGRTDEPFRLRARRR
jgi:hypothetical protein